MEVKIPTTDGDHLTIEFYRDGSFDIDHNVDGKNFVGIYVRPDAAKAVAKALANHYLKGK